MPSEAVVEGLSGAVGGCVATVVTYPLMTVRMMCLTFRNLSCCVDCCDCCEEG